MVKRWTQVSPPETRLKARNFTNSNHLSVANAGSVPPEITPVVSLFRPPTTQTDRRWRLKVRLPYTGVITVIVEDAQHDAQYYSVQGGWGKPGPIDYGAAPVIDERGQLIVYMLHFNGAVDRDLFVLDTGFRAQEV